MPEQNSHQVWVERYVQDEMTEQEMAFFEEALMDSPALQQELETVLALRMVLAADSVPEPDAEATPYQAQPLNVSGKWQGLALAATVVLAVFSTVMYWKTSNDQAALQRQLAELGSPRTQVLTVPLDIMRSAGSETPDVIVKKPAGRAAILLDIELTPATRQLDTVNFSLLESDGSTVATWTSLPDAQGHATVLLNVEDVPVGRLWLQIDSPDGEATERRLLEFR